METSTSDPSQSGASVSGRPLKEVSTGEGGLVTVFSPSLPCGSGGRSFPLPCGGGQQLGTPLAEVAPWALLFHL